MTPLTLRPQARMALRAAATLLAVALAMVLAVQAWYLARILHYREHDPATTAFMDMRRAEGVEVVHEWVSYEQISPWVKRAVIAAEDAHFSRHNGFDWEALHAALIANLEADGVVRGGSTISQQLAKNLFLSPRRTVTRKAQEAVITVMLEAVLDKQRILELYLNVIEWGDGVFGIGAAARHYHGLPARRVGHWRAALLAARIPRPRYYDHRGRTPYLVDRAGEIYRWAPDVRLP